MSSKSRSSFQSRSAPKKKVKKDTEKTFVPNPFQRYDVKATNQKLRTLQQAVKNNNKQVKPLEVIPLKQQSQQDYFEARNEWLQASGHWLHQIQKEDKMCNINNALTNIKVLRSHESASRTVIIFATLEIPIEYLTKIHPKYLDTTIYPTFQNVVCKVSVDVPPEKREDLDFENSLDVERYVYAFVSSELIAKHHDPHFINYLVDFECSFANLKISNKEDEIYLKEQLAKVNHVPLKNITNDSTIIIIVSEQASGMFWGDFFDKHLLTKEQVLQVVFQEIWSITCSNLKTLSQHDKHSGNIFLAELPDHHTFHYVIPETNVLTLRTKLYVQDYDFDQATIYNSSVPRNFRADESSSCDIFNQCNEPTKIFDILGFLYHLSTRLRSSKSRQQKEDHQSLILWIEELFPPKIWIYLENQRQVAKEINGLEEELKQVRAQLAQMRLQKTTKTNNSGYIGLANEETELMQELKRLRTETDALHQAEYPQLAVSKRIQSLTEAQNAHLPTSLQVLNRFIQNPKLNNILGILPISSKGSIPRMIYWTLPEPSTLSWHKGGLKCPDDYSQFFSHQQQQQHLQRRSKSHVTVPAHIYTQGNQLIAQVSHQTPGFDISSNNTQITTRKRGRRPKNEEDISRDQQMLHTLTIQEIMNGPTLPFFKDKRESTKKKDKETILEQLREIRGDSKYQSISIMKFNDNARNLYFDTLVCNEMDLYLRPYLWQYRTILNIWREELIPLEYTFSFRQIRYDLYTYYVNHVQIETLDQQKIVWLALFLICNPIWYTLTSDFRKHLLECFGHQHFNVYLDIYSRCSEQLHKISIPVLNTWY